MDGDAIGGAGAHFHRESFVRRRSGSNREPAHPASSQAHGSCTAFGASNALVAGTVGEPSQIQFDQSQERSLGQLEFDRLSPKIKPNDKSEQLGGQRTLGWRSVELDVTDMATADMRCEGRQDVDLQASGVQNAGTIGKAAYDVQRSKRQNKTKNAAILGSSRRALAWAEFFGVEGSSAELYKQSLRVFIDWATDNGKRLVEDDEVDEALVGYVNKSFFAGVQAHVGERLMAGLMSAEVPEFSQTGRRTTPRAWRCLRGWRRLCPCHSRRPYPLPVWAAMANQLSRQSYRLMTIALLFLVLQSYLRPGELVNLRKPDFVEAKRGVFGSWSLIVCPKERSHPTKNRNLGRQCPPGLRVAELDGSTEATSDRASTSANNAGLWTQY